MSYSVSIEADSTGEPGRPYGAYFLFPRWRRQGEQGVDGHLETGFLSYGDTPAQARVALGEWRLQEVKRELDACIAASTAGGTRKWWDAMRDET